MEPTPPTVLSRAVRLIREQRKTRDIMKLTGLGKSKVCELRRHYSDAENPGAETATGVQDEKARAILPALADRPEPARPSVEARGGG